MRITRDDFISLARNPNLFDDFHVWEVMMLFGTAGKMTIRREKFTCEGCETPEELYEALMDLLRGCRFAGVDYSVFCDDRLVTDL